MKKINLRDIKLIFISLGTFLFLAGAGGVLFIYSGLYDIIARHPHMDIVREVLLTTKTQSIRYHAQDLKVPDLNDPQLIQKGFLLYQRNCLTCHGAPGTDHTQMSVGLNPNPPPLEKAVQQWTTAEIGWVIANGLKMAGMPAFLQGENYQEVWAMTAFVNRMNTLSPQEYQMMVESIDRPELRYKIKWLPEDGHWEKLAVQGDPLRGQKQLKKYGCTTCHKISGLSGPSGATGPSLENWKQRQYIIGRFINNPKNLIPWIRTPQEIDPGNVMPNLNVTEEEAWDMASYLYQSETH
jgi:mono/diheme cytochrome c family protein